MASSCDDLRYPSAWAVVDVRMSPFSANVSANSSRTAYPLDRPSSQSFDRVAVSKLVGISLQKPESEATPTVVLAVMVTMKPVNEVR